MNMNEYNIQGYKYREFYINNLFSLLRRWQLLALISSPAGKILNSLTLKIEIRK
jgi:hypothetical protein